MAKTKTTKASKKLKAHITYLEMSEPHIKVIPAPSRPATALMVARNITSNFYSYIYEMVGKPCHWLDRREVDAEDLYDIINDEACEIGILYADGCPAGFYELNLNNMPNDIEIKYFGIGPEYQGMGLGKWFLGLTIQAAWAHKPEKVTIETNTLDHPAALRMYQQMGFSPVGVGEAEIEAWE